MLIVRRLRVHGSATLRVAPLPQQLRHLVHTLFFQRRKQAHLTTAGIEPHDGQRLGLLSARELVGLGQQHQKLQPLLHPGAQGIEQRLVQLGQAQARIAQQHHRRQALALHQVVQHHALPALFIAARNGRVAIAGQVGQHRIGHPLLAQRKQVDVLCAPRFLRGKSQLFLLRQRIDRGRFTRIGATHKGDFWHSDWGQLL